MVERKEIEVRLFGAFRDFSSSLAIPISGGETAHAIKSLLKKRFLEAGQKGSALLVERSVLATENRVLGDAEEATGDALALLPPVCGG